MNIIKKSTVIAHIAANHVIALELMDRLDNKGCLKDKAELEENSREIASYINGKKE